MGITTQEFTSSGLTAMYPSHYKEFQIINWTCEDIVITEHSGEQFVQPKSTMPAHEDHQCVLLECRYGDGMRIDTASTGAAGSSRQLPLKAKRTSIPIAEFKQHPIRIEEYDVIISTVEQAVIAKNMMCDCNYGLQLQETAVDAIMTDPRLVFQVIDPNNQWDMLLVNVFGQTIVLRSGRFSRFTSSVGKNTNIPETGRLICYLRYPTDMYTGSLPRQVVFDIPLTDLHKKEPYLLPSGDYVCVAEDMDALNEVMYKKSTCTEGIATGNLSDKMMPKEVHVAEIEDVKSEIERIKALHRNQIETLTANKNAEISKLKQDLVDAQHRAESAEAASRTWEHSSQARFTYEEQRAKSEAAVEKARIEAIEAAQANMDQMWTTMKIGGAALAGVLTFAITMLLKSKK